jgi:hypothetical protein
MQVVNIVNKSLDNQRRTGWQVEQGLKALGIEYQTTSNINARGDVTIVHGMNYAKDQAQGDVLWLDRCWYGNTEQWLSIGWKVDNNTRRYCEGDGTRFFNHVAHGFAEYHEASLSRRVIILDDYQQSLHHMAHLADYRGHPAHEHHVKPLQAVLRDYGSAICGFGTSAAQAKLAGLEVECNDPHNVVHSDLPRRQWAESLAWKQWHVDEICNGTALQRLLDIREAVTS